MADDPDDPNQPVVDPPPFAGTTERARIIRRRRAAFIGGLAVVLVVGAIVAALLVANDDDDDDDDGRLDNVAASAISATSVPPGGGETIPQGTSPETALSVPTTPPPTPPQSVVTSTATTVASVTSVAPSTTTPAPTTTTAAATTTTTVVRPIRPVVAIDANGDAVIVNLDGSTTLLHDGTDPDDPPPAEGEVVVVDAVAVTNDGSTAFIGTCCEPVPGAVLRTSPPAVATFESSAFGHAPAISPDGTKVAIDVLSAVSVTDLRLANIASTAENFLTGSGIGIVWIDDERFAVLTAAPESARLQSVTLAAGNTLQAGPSWASTSGVDAFGTSLAGFGDGVIYISGLTPSTLTAFDSVTMQPAPAGDVTLPGDPLSAWMQDGELRWVDQDRQLHIGGTVVPGEFIWVR